MANCTQPSEPRRSPRTVDPTPYRRVRRLTGVNLYATPAWFNLILRACRRYPGAPPLAIRQALRAAQRLYRLDLALSFYLGRFIASLHDVSAVVRYLNAEDAGHCVMDQRLYPSLTELTGQQFPILILQAFDRSTMLLISQRPLSLLSSPHTEVI